MSAENAGIIRYKRLEPRTARGDPGLQNCSRRRPTLPRSCPRSTIGAEELNFRVRNGNGCGLSVIVAGNNYFLIFLTIDRVFFVLKADFSAWVNFMAKPHGLLVLVS